MRRFAMMSLVMLATACGGELPRDRLDGDSCYPDPSEARAVVRVTLRNNMDDLDASIDRVNQEHGLEFRHANAWTADIEVESGDAGSFADAGSAPDYGKEISMNEALDVLRGHRLTLQTRHGDFIAKAHPATRTVTLDRSCELVIVVGDEWEDDGETLRFTLSHFWR